MTGKSSGTNGLVMGCLIILPPCNKRWLLPVHVTSLTIKAYTHSHHCDHSNTPCQVLHSNAVTKAIQPAGNHRSATKNISPQKLLWSLGWRDMFDQCKQLWSVVLRCPAEMAAYWWGTSRQYWNWGMHASCKQQVQPLRYCAILDPHSIGQSNRAGFLVAICWTAPQQRYMWPSDQPGM